MPGPVHAEQLRALTTELDWLSFVRVFVCVCVCLCARSSPTGRLLLPKPCPGRFALGDRVGCSGSAGFGSTPVSPMYMQCCTVVAVAGILPAVLLCKAPVWRNCCARVFLMFPAAQGKRCPPQVMVVHEVFLLTHNAPLLQLVVATNPKLRQTATCVACVSEGVQATACFLRVNLLRRGPPHQQLFQRPPPLLYSQV